MSDPVNPMGSALRMDNITQNLICPFSNSKLYDFGNRLKIAIHV